MSRIPVARAGRAVLVSLLVALVGWVAFASSALADEPSAGPRAGLAPGKAMLDKVYAEATAQANARAKKLQGTANLAIRKASATAFTGLTSSAAIGLTQKTFPGLLETPSAAPLRAGQAADTYLSDYAARVKDPAARGGTALVTSLLPLRTKDADGKVAPVDVTLAAGSDGWVPKNALEHYRVASSSNAGIQFTDTGVAVHPEGRDVQGSLQDASVFYPGTQTDTDTIVKSLDTGAEVMWQVRSAQSPEQFVLDVDLPDGTTLGQPGPHGVLIVRDGKTIGTISPAIATDADGESVKTNTAVKGNQIIVSVAHRGQDVHYPILVDPTIAATYVFPYDGPDAATSKYFWYTYDLAGGKIGRFYGDYGYGNGLYLQNSGYPSTLGLTGGSPSYSDHAGWYYAAPGQARIFEVQNSDSKNIWGGDPLQICMVSGIANPSVSDWEGPNGYTWGEGCSPFASYAWHVYVPNGAGSPGNTFVFGVYTYTSGNWAFNDYYRDAVIYMDDADAPSAPRIEAPTDAWINGDNTGTIRVYGTDPSTGLAKFTLSTNGWSTEVTNPNCATGPCTNFACSPCQQSWDNGDTNHDGVVNGNDDPSKLVPVTSLPDGFDEVTVTATDPAGNTGPPSTVRLAVDKTDPPAPTLGSARLDPSTGVTTISWTPVTDPTPADGSQPSQVAHYDYRYAANGGSMSQWASTVGPTFPVSGTTAGESFDVEVRAVDGAGNLGAVTTGTLIASATSDTTPPSLQIYGPLFDRSGDTAWDGLWDLSAYATDDGGTGVAEIRMTVNGQHMTDLGQTIANGFEVGRQGQFCSTAGCSLRLDGVPYDTREYPEGPAVIAVTATDFAGNASTQTFTVQNSYSDEPAPAPAFAVYTAGNQFDGLDMTSATTYVDRSGPRPIQHVAYAYGDCKVSTGPCVPPIEVLSAPVATENVGRYTIPSLVASAKSTTVRGVPATSFEDGKRLELYTGDTTISVLGDDPDQVKRFADRVAPAASADVPSASQELHALKADPAPPTKLAPPSLPKQLLTPQTVSRLDPPNYDFPYETMDEGCNTEKDPVNVIVTGTDQSAQRVNDDLKDNGWGHTSGFAGDPQWYNDPVSGTCRKQQSQNADHNFFGGIGPWAPDLKKHVRQLQVTGTQGGVTIVAGDAHRDHKTSACGKGWGPFKSDTVPAKVNGTTGYNDGQNQFNAVYGPFYVDYYRGPSTVYRQCDYRTGDPIMVGWNQHINYYQLDAGVHP